MKAIRQAQTRNILDSYNKEDISYSRMNEMFNELAEDFAIGFAEWLRDECYDTGDEWLYQDDETYDSQELLEIYKKEKGL